MLNVFAVFGNEIPGEEVEGFAELWDERVADEVSDGLLFFVVGVDVDFKLDCWLASCLAFSLVERVDIRHIRLLLCRGRLQGL